MRALDRKLLRDLWRLKWQAAAIALLIACGVAVSVTAFSTQEALRSAQQREYAAARFADVFATAKRAPLSVTRDLARIDGVVAVDARAMKVGLMQVPGLERPATARLISLPDDDQAGLNRMVLVQGRMPAPGRADEAVALKTFLDAAHVGLGQRLWMVIDGRRFSVIVVGAALSAEFAYLPGPASQLPDDAHQGVFWAPRPWVERATGLGGAFSSVSLKLAPGASGPAALAAVDRLLAPYGGQPAYLREDQVSTKFQDEHIKQLGIMALVIPPIFLAVAAGLVSLVLGRMVDSEREQIGLLKAFGYEDWEAASNYLRLALVIGLIGAVAGALLGAWLAGALTGLFSHFVRFTQFERRFSWIAFAGASLVSMAAAAAGSLLAVRRAVRLSPAVAMQPPTPAVFRRGLIERLPLWAALDQPTRMIVRSFERYPGRALLTMTGFGLSLSLLIGTQFFFGSVDEIMDQAYFRARRWTDVIGFAEARDARAVAEAARLPGVIAAEPIRIASARIRVGGREEKTILFGLDPGASLARPLDGRDRPIGFEGRGLVLSDSLARRLGVQAGDQAEVEVYEDRRPRVLLPVTAIARDYAGLSAYMARGELNRLMGEGDLASGANLRTATDRRPAFYDAIVGAPLIVGSSSRDDVVAEWRRSVAGTMTVEMTLYLAFASAIAFGIAYNVCRIDLSDRARDLATLRVLGFGEAECAYILAGELMFLGLAATPLGVLGGQALAQTLSVAFSHEEMRIPAIITADAYGRSLAAYLTAIAVAGALVVSRVWSLDLVSVLKSKE
ncbi:ABC transporter permease [Caulobacter sp. KR2-114]|uniref:ABC transporter permease n=1 Tax=Caulobacter sp. KR2-114 TaxID=3400912 RepID=UPI003C05B45F